MNLKAVNQKAKKLNFGVFLWSHFVMGTFNVSWYKELKLKSGINFIYKNFNRSDNDGAISAHHMPSS